ncbi:sn-glycerol-3-phosphate ABC transporter ATP-binding protein UgpC [Deinococcus metallilatus]|uniref:Multiple sugar transport system ATP-binding protein n=1 Tax=Deinococcus metallilatus TaxID=1211322 RepID=A0AAJ5JYE0_9DEIO|nr:sn-glycerol-3-phosphate ABC transporter ATP-binding protein UgpC [Deinococcus metallilatus]MBB5295046.1 multiple sugar transport system ATP-binding protein [Deinococcus metallilatus]QBY08772.1 sn-glycerol-3-phosphate ABC transporter ATP-binding protein UgpC [Deinococcus metallilatus]RXJ10652.1 sn-glycerol-3-phosphate ABC transporter ATP-binding protein UgpC [Deinococcus metallilatus]TLK26623.1 sn-glycerol-3-phosphate ABC transporter ATP-binding protein UgpC [Deinococcus metallilatus]GMA1481
MAEVVLEHIHKYYGTKQHAVKDFNLDIADREFMVFVGPSGCGKSTTLRMIAGLEDISDGVLRIGDRVVNDVPPKDRDIAMVFQNYALYPHMNVYENMAFGLKLRKTPKAEIDKRVRDAARILQIEHLLGRKPKELSGGQRQRVAMGRAIVREPKVFLMDEPLSNLDAKLRVEMRSQISQLHRRLGATIIYVTHDQVEAMTLGDRIVVMRDGVIMQVDTPMNLYDFPQNKFVAGFIGSPSMNFLTARVQNGEFVVGGSRVAPMGRLAQSLRAYEGKEVYLGIRPEHIGVVGQSDIPQGVNVLRGKIVVVEPLGAQTDLIIDVDGQDITAKVEGQAAVDPGDDIELLIDQTRLHAFDHETEMAIDRGTPTGKRGQADTLGLGYEYGTPATSQAPGTVTVISADD